VQSSLPDCNVANFPSNCAEMMLGGCVGSTGWHYYSTTDVDREEGDVRGRLALKKNYR
jgi:hypothetical protein